MLGFACNRILIRLTSAHYDFSVIQFHWFGVFGDETTLIVQPGFAILSIEFKIQTQLPYYLFTC